MKTRLLLIVIIAVATVAVGLIGLFYLFITANGFSYYYEGMSLTYVSEYEFQDILKQDYMQGVTITTITDDELESVPKIKELIIKAQSQKFPLNEEGRVLSDFDTLKKYHQYYAKILSEKYSKEPEEFVRILPAHPSDLEISSKAYNYEFDGEFFEYNGVQYGWSNSQFVDYGTDNRADITAYKIRHPLDPERHVWGTITDEDLKEMPLLKEAIHNIGTIQESIQVENSMSNSELKTYQKWIEENIPFGIFEYGGKHFRTGSWVA